MLSIHVALTRNIVQVSTSQSCNMKHNEGALPDFGNIEHEKCTFLANIKAKLEYIDNLFKST